MASTATITALSGPAIQATSVVLNGVTAVDFNFAGEVLSVTYGAPSITAKFALTGANTITLTVSAGVYTLAVS